MPAPPADAPAPASTIDARARLVLAACCAVAFSKLVDPQVWMMGLTIPESAFGEAWLPYRGFSGINVLVLTAFLLFGGLLGDLFGRRRILLVGTAVALIANLLCTLGAGPAWFVVFRGLEGFGSALAFPMTLAIIQGSFNGRGQVIALLIYTLTAALAAITSLSALAITTQIDWRATLILPIVAGTLGLVLAWRYTPESRSGTRTDLQQGVVITGWSLILLAVTLGLLTSRQADALTNPVTLVAIGLGALGALVLLFNRLSATVVPGRSRLDWHQRHALTITLLSAVVLNLGLSGYLAQVFGYLTIVQGMGPVQGGLALAPLFLAALLLARPAARITIRTDERRLIVAGLGLMSAAMLFTAALASPTMPYWPLVVPMGVFGFAFLVTQTAWNDAFLRVIPPNLIGASAGTSKAAAQAGTWLGTALLATIVLRFGEADFAQRLAALGLSADQITQATSVVDAALRADAPTGPPTDQATLATLGLLNAYYASYTVGFTTALLWAAGICVAMAAGVWIVFRTPVSGGRRSPGRAAAQQSATDAPAPRPDSAARSSSTDL